MLKHAKSRDFITKTGIMLGIGERKEEVAQLIRDIAAADVDILTIGQYLSPSKEQGGGRKKAGEPQMGTDSHG